jgi:hypothetical protein
VAEEALTAAWHGERRNAAERLLLGVSCGQPLFVTLALLPWRGLAGSRHLLCGFVDSGLSTADAACVDRPTGDDLRCRALGGPIIMSNKSPQKNNSKKPSSRTLKEKRVAKKAKHVNPPSSIPPTGH